MKKLILFFVIFAGVPVVSMERDLECSKPAKPTCRALFSGDNSIESEIIQKIRALRPGSTVTVESAYLGDRMLKALEKAAKKGVKVTAQSTNSKYLKQRIRDKEEEDNLELLRAPGHHVKRVTIEDPRTKDMVGSPKKQVFVGSDNLSNTSWANKEMMAEINDQELCKQHIKGAKYNQTISSPVKGAKKILYTTPTKKKVVNLQRYDHLLSLAQRIETLKESKDETDSLDISSMTFDSKVITHALVSLKKKRPKVPVRLILDRAALKHQNLLDKLDAAGVELFIYNASGEEKIWSSSIIPTLQHTKIMTRRCKGKELTIVSTGNLTEQSNIEVNVDTYMGDEMFDEIREFNDNLIAECMRYGDHESESESSSSSESESSESESTSSESE